MASFGEISTHTQCNTCRKKGAEASTFRTFNDLGLFKSGSLSPSRRERLEKEADQMADRFMSSRLTPLPRKLFSGLRTGNLSQAHENSVLKKESPSISQFPLPHNTFLLKNADEEEALTGAKQKENKGGDSIEETAETNVGEPNAGQPPREEEEVLTKRGDNRIKPVSFSPLMAGGGSALPTSEKQEMGTFFGRDFSTVRIHNDKQSHQYTQRIGALAATKSNHIYFSNRINPDRYQHLLAHELTHVVQQKHAPRLSHHLAPVTTTDETNAQSVQRQAEPSSATSSISDAPVDWQLYQDTICRGKDNEHDSTQPRDFPETYISKINVSISDQKVTLDWTGPSVAEAEEIVQRVTGNGVINCSTGAGVRGETSCNDAAHSITTGSCCTPIGSFTLGAQSCVTPRLNLQNFSGFQRAGIGLHYYSSVPSHPASHGCVRLHRGASKIIFDNARSGHTTVEVSGSYSSRYRRHGSCS